MIFRESDTRNGVIVMDTDTVKVNLMEDDKMIIIEIRKIFRKLSRAKKFQLLQKLLADLKVDELEVSDYFTERRPLANWSQIDHVEASMKLEEFANGHKSQ